MKILIAGDFCPRYRVAEKFEKGDYESILGEVKEIISDADYSIVNFECPVTKGGEKPIEKCGPNLQCSEKGIEAVKWVGIDCVTLANNHFLDYGKEGVEHTLEACEKYGVDTVGGGMNLQEASKILYKEIEGNTLAIINCCEHEFSIATEETAGSNPLNPIQQYYAIKEARTKADHVLVIVHGGHEHYQLPSPRMQETYRFFVDAGADAVVNHHQHCYSGYEIYNGKPIFYGLGNFCFDWKGKQNSIWNEGYMVTIDFNNENINYCIYPYLQCSQNAEVNLLPTNAFEQMLSKFNIIIINRKLLTEETEKYYQKNLHDSNLMLEPISNRYIRALQSRHLLPTYYFGKKHLLRFYNFLLCESHKDKISYFLENKYKKMINEI